MRELVGQCVKCTKEIFCLDGFLNGILTDEKEVYCFECMKTVNSSENPPQN